MKLRKLMEAKETLFLVKVSDRLGHPSEETLAVVAAKDANEAREKIRKTYRNADRFHYVEADENKVAFEKKFWQHQIENAHDQIKTLSRVIR